MPLGTLTKDPGLLTNCKQKNRARYLAPGKLRPAFYSLLVVAGCVSFCSRRVKRTAVLLTVLD